MDMFINEKGERKVRMLFIFMYKGYKETIAIETEPNLSLAEYHTMMEEEFSEWIEEKERSDKFKKFRKENPKLELTKWTRIIR